MSFSSNPASPERMREIMESVPTEIIDNIMANLLRNPAEQMYTTKDTFIQWPVDFQTASYHSRSLREAHIDLHNFALVSEKFRKSANPYLYQMLEINDVHGLMNIWESLSTNPANAASVRYLLCCLSFDSPTARRTISKRTSDLFGQMPLLRWADGVQLSIDDLHSEDDFARRLFLDLIRRCSKLRRLFLHHNAASLIQGLPSLSGAPQTPLCALGQTLCMLAFKQRPGYKQEKDTYRPKTCGEHLQGCARLVMPCLRVIQILAQDGIWWIALENSRNCPSSTIVQRILSLVISHDGYHDAHPVLQYVGLQDMRRLEQFQVRTCLLNPETPGRPALPLGSHNLNHELAHHAEKLKILHIDAPIECYGDPKPHPEGKRLLTCLPSLRTLVSLHISLHLLFPTLQDLRNELECQPHKQEVLATFVTQCPDTLQNIHFIENWHPLSLGRPGSAREDRLGGSYVSLTGLAKYMCENWLTQDGKPQQRTLQLTPQFRSFYSGHTHAHIKNHSWSLGRLKALWMVGPKVDTYTYQLVEEVSYRGVHEQLLPLELVHWE